ncbi:penicillin acylase family protein [Sphingomonas sp. MG17]|uniref:Penicillin acylase family protein n=1 Tax=Sphingomonas tagetis TaxID=2949092 RepID=A0A9X2HGU9_9SPHN|nr:penicillin acylase family protein [Sphingomonas tagetis]MCP3730553.1 penicillin acylase family protein [Sphingomonas tagetis]
MTVGSMRIRAGIAVLLASASVAAAFPAQAAPGTDATITRTRFGIPHIKAKTFAGLGYGAAYAQAQDNICLLADAYMSVAGERSRFFGPDGAATIGVWPGKNIDNDVFYRTVLDDAALTAGFRRLAPDSRAVIDGWVAGYNRFLKDRAGRLPAACANQPWVRDITRLDVLRWANAFQLFASSAGLSVQIAQTRPPGTEPAKAAPATGAVASGEIMLGSNGWAFGGDATANGRGLVVGNPHFPWIGPNRFYQMHMTIAGKFDVAGAGIMGQPYIGIGFNKDVAWTHTVDTAVHMTLARLTLDPADPTVYLVDGKRMPMIRRQLSIPVKDGAPIVRTVYASRHGPIVSIPGTPYAWTRETAWAVRDANHNNMRAADNYLAFGRARTVDDLRAALTQHMGSGFINTIAADRGGASMFADITPAPNLSAERFAECGKRGDKLPNLYSRMYELDGSRSSCDWASDSAAPAPGLLPGREMVVQLRRDYVQNSNDSYRWTNPALPPVERAPMLGTDPGPLPDMRTRSGVQAIRAMLAAGKVDIDRGAAAMLSNKVFVADLVLGDLLQLCKRSGAPADACAALAKWDGKMEVDSRGGMLFSAFWMRVTNSGRNIWKTPFDPKDIVGTPASLDITGAAGDALLADLTAAAGLFKLLGVPLDAPLGQIQFAERGAERIPVSGGAWGGVLNWMGGLPTKGGFNVIHGSSYIQSVTFDDKGPVAKSILTYSQSSDPASPHHADQTREFAKKQLHRFPFTDAEIAADAIGQPLKLGK